MSEFDFQTKTRVAYGIGRSKQIGEDVKALSGGTHAVLVTDPGLVKVGVADEIASALRGQGVEVTIFSDVQSDPSSVSIDEAASVIRESNTRCVIGLGGGSAMDVAKLAALVAGANHPTEHYALMANPFEPKQIKTIMIPTTSGTGAEVTSTVVFSNREKRKVWGWDYDLAPDLALLDPTLTVALPPHLTAATGLDALIHALEAVAGKRGNAIIQAVGLQAIRMISGSLMQVIENPQNLEARGQLSIGSMFGGMAIEQGGTGIAHCMGHALGTLARIHHGRAVAISLYHAYEWNIEGNEAIHAEIARAMGAVHTTSTSVEDQAHAGAQFYRKLVEDSGMLLSLAADGLTLSNVDRLAETAASTENAPMRNNNCRYAADEDLNRLAKLILQ
ncbi:iron-containing alcohol dehydrogenase [Cohnella sp. WQ 127256]|uniref:iron-containing alcohol dehydrogenase n=1 Tax=Cohnella sp. WQ 127256 TaxID=2938790 RepID=UPI002118DF2D|nr:iron-containing alcohol dehydrogenase [Cohnella sp. WQ 127256]